MIRKGVDLVQLSPSRLLIGYVKYREPQTCECCERQNSRARRVCRFCKYRESEITELISERKRRGIWYGF